MKIALISDEDIVLSSSAMSSRVTAYAKALINENFDITVINFSKTKKDDSYYKNIHCKYIFNNISNKYFLKSIIEYTNSLNKVFDEYDIIFSSETRIFYLLIFTNLAYKKNKKIVLELNENPYSTVGSRKDFYLINEIKKTIFLNLIIKKFDGIITITESLNAIAKKYISSKTKTITVPIISLIYSESVRELKTTEKYIIHAGSLSEKKDGIKAMLKGYYYAKSKTDVNLKFIFTSKTAFPSLIRWIENFINKCKLKDNVIFTGYLDKYKLNEYLDSATLAIINKPINNQNLYNFPTKLTELLPRGIPCIISKTGVLNEFFEDEVNCYMVNPNNYQEIGEKILKIINDPTKAESIGFAGKITSNRLFFYKSQSAKLKYFFNELMLLS